MDFQQVSKICLFYSPNSSKVSNAEHQRAKDAQEQASLVGAEIGKDMKAISVENRIDNKIKVG